LAVGQIELAIERDDRRIRTHTSIRLLHYS
jgi:hypothetical protein